MKFIPYDRIFISQGSGSLVEEGMMNMKQGWLPGIIKMDIAVIYTHVAEYFRCVSSDKIIH